MGTQLRASAHVHELLSRLVCAYCRGPLAPTAPTSTGEVTPFACGVAWGCCSKCLEAKSESLGGWQAEKLERVRWLIPPR